MVINKLVFLVNVRERYFEAAKDSYKLTANNINRDFIYVISPAVSSSVIYANFQSDLMREGIDSALMMLADETVDELVSKTAYYYETVKNWRVWKTPIPSQVLTKIAHNRAGRINISFSFKEIIANGVDKVDYFIRDEGDILDNDGVYLVEIPIYQDIYRYRDILIKDGGNIEVKKAKVQIGNTETVSYSVEPSIGVGDFETIDLSLECLIVSELGEHARRLEQAEEDIVDHERRLGNAEYELGEHDGRITEIEETEIPRIDQELLRLENDKVDKSVYNPKISNIEGDILDLETNKADLSYVNQELGEVGNELVRLENDKADITYVISKIASDLANYYTKSETYTQAQVNSLISQIPKFKVLKVNELPSSNIDLMAIYIVGDKEYIWLENESRWEMLGTLEVDMADYYDKTDIDLMLGDYLLKIGDRVTGDIEFYGTEKGLRFVNDYDDKEKASIIYTSDNELFIGLENNRIEIQNDVMEFSYSRLGKVGRAVYDNDVVTRRDVKPLIESEIEVELLSGNATNVNFEMSQWYLSEVTFWIDNVLVVEKGLAKSGYTWEIGVNNYRLVGGGYNIAFCFDNCSEGVKNDIIDINAKGGLIKLLVNAREYTDEKLGDSFDPNAMSYFDYAGRIYGDKYSLLASAWEHSLTVDVVDKDHYQNGTIKGVIIPQGVTSIGNDAFRNWTSNNQPLVIPDSVTSIGNYAFFNWTSNTHTLVIPNSVTSIGDFAFYNWTSNNHPLVIPDSVTSIGDGAFDGWTSNNQPLVIPDSVTSIGSYAFSNWASNTHPLVIPNSVTSIGTNAFHGWSEVPYVEMQSITPPTLTNANAFGNQNNAPIYVPNDSVDDYKEATQWVSLADRIFPISDKCNTYTKGEIDLMIGDIESVLDAILGV